MNKKLFVVLPIAALVVVLAVYIIGKNRSASGTDEGGRAAAAEPAEAKELEAKNDLIGARSVYQKLANESSGANLNEIIRLQKKVEDLNLKLLFSPVVTEHSMLYEIKPGDTLVRIAKEFKTTPELIMKSNNLSSNKIMPGKKIKVWNAPFSIFVDKSQNILFLKCNEEVIKTYIVSTGKNNSSPVGVFKIVNKLANPTWFKSGAVIPANSPENILGSRWMGFDNPGFGIHGTTDPKNLGNQVTAGCVRMSNTEVEELYIIIPVGTEVTIVD